MAQIDALLCDYNKSHWNLCFEVTNCKIFKLYLSNSKLVIPKVLNYMQFLIKGEII